LAAAAIDVLAMPLTVGLAVKEIRLAPVTAVPGLTPNRPPTVVGPCHCKGSQGTLELVRQCVIEVRRKSEYRRK
jgi:hypothetical protein